MTSLKDLNSVAVNVLRRLGRGEKVESTHYRKAGQNLATAFEQLTRSGLVSEQATPKGRKRFFVCTALGRTLLPAVERLDAETAVRRQSEAAKEDAAERVARAAPLLLTALRGLLATCRDPAMNSDNDTEFNAAIDRHHQAMVVADDAVKHATKV